MLCYSDQYGISEDETGNKLITHRTAGPEVLASLKTFPENVP